MKDELTQAQKISIKVTGCIDFKNCSWDVFERGIKEATLAERQRIINLLAEITAFEITDKRFTEIIYKINSEVKS